MIPSNYMKIQMNLGRGVDGDEEGRQRGLDEVEEARGRRAWTTTRCAAARAQGWRGRGGTGAAGRPGTVATRSGRRRGGGRKDDLEEPGRRGQASCRGGRRGRGAGTADDRGGTGGRGRGRRHARSGRRPGRRRGRAEGGGGARHVDLKK